VTSARRNILAGLALVVLLVGGLVVWRQVQGGSGSSSVATGTTLAPVGGAGSLGSAGSTAASDTAPTTIELLPVIATTTAPPPAPVVTAGPAPTLSATTQPPSTTTTLPPVTGSGAVLTPPPALDERVVPAGATCTSLADDGWMGVQCAVVHAKGATLIWLTETQPVSASAVGLRAYVFRGNGAGKEDVVLRAADDQGVRFSAVRVKVDSIAAGGGQDIVFGFHGQDQSLSVDLVHGSGVVAVHEDLTHGSARSATGQLDTWTETGPSYRHDTISFDGSTWRVVATASVAPASVPPSQL